MPLPILDIPMFANVPMVPGVPPMFRNAAFQFDAVSSVLASDSEYVTRQANNQRWGLVDQTGQFVIETDSTVSVSYVRDSRLLTYPVEDGGFRSYNKVMMPFEPVVTLAKGGSLSDRVTFVSRLEEIVGDLNIYSFITPEHTFTNVNIERISYDRRADRSAGQMVIDVHMKEIRLTGVTEFVNTASPDGIADRNIGPVQVTEMSDEDVATFMSGFR